MKKFFFFILAIVGVAVVPSVIFAQTATLSFLPAIGTVQAGQFLTVTIMLNTGGAQVNAVGVYFTYPENLLEGISLDTTGSGLDTFTPERTVGSGKVAFSGGKLPPPLVGLHKLFSVTFRAKSTLQSAQLAFTGDSGVLTHGESKNILNLAGSAPATFQIVAASPVPPPSPTPTPTPTPASTPSAPAEFVISDIKAEKLSEESVRLSWKTSQPTKGSVNYGPRTKEEYLFSVVSGVLASEHSFVLSDVNVKEDYRLEIIGRDEQGNQAKAENLILSALLQKEDESVPLVPSNGEVTVEGFKIPSSMLLLFVGLPILVVLLVIFLIVWRMRARS